MLPASEKRPNAGERFLELAGWIYDAALWALLAAGAVAIVGALLVQWLAVRDAGELAQQRLCELEGWVERLERERAARADLAEVPPGQAETR